MDMRTAMGVVIGMLLCAPLGVYGQGGSESVSSAKAIPANATNATLWIIPHTHWEGAVFKTREEYLEIGLPNILRALEILKTHPEYRFVLDQVAYVKPFLERYPEQEAVFRKMVSEGKLEIVCANNVMLDVNIPSGESWIRQALYGKTYYREKLGVERHGGLGARHLRAPRPDAATPEARGFQVILVPARSAR